MNRRGLMKAIFGGAAAAASGVTPKDLIAASGNIPTPDLNSVDVACAAIQNPTEERIWRKASKARRLIERRQDDFRWPPYMPPHIASKKSWSDAYKHSEFNKEMRALREAYDRLEDNDIAAQIWDRLTGESE